MANKYPTPIPTPVKNLRPAQETCEECHWPKKFVGNVERTFNYFLTDKDNSPFSIRMLIKVGGGDSTHGPVGGIHWHMNVGNKIEYIAVDDARQKIPWVRMTDPQGVVREFRDTTYTNDLKQFATRRMDCMDCHNRPAHRYETPERAVNIALAQGKIDRALPFIKTNAIDVLVKPYKTEAEALQNIATLLISRYNDAPNVRAAIDVVQEIYKDNFFPEMKANWRAYPDNIGHKDWQGCFRCHDGKHVTSDRTLSIKSKDCDACHTILSQGSGKELEQLSFGQKFKHPEEEYDPAYMCTDCHTGGL
jgi:nitrate/TMAO reductase-like tetraheme cytochrome c subunit